MLQVFISFYVILFQFMSLTEVDIFECSLHISEVTASFLQVRKSIWNTVPQHPPNAILPNSFWLTCQSPAWTHMMWSDSLYSFNFPFYFPRACIYFSRWNMKVLLSHKLLLRNLSLNDGFGAICAISCYLFPIPTGPSHTEIAITQSVFLSAIQNKLIHSINSLI